MKLIEPAISSGALIARLTEEKALTVPILRPEIRSLLLLEAESYDYQEQAPEYGPYRTKQTVSSVIKFRKNSMLHTLRDELQDWLQECAASFGRDPFERPFMLNQIRLQRYPHATDGIAPHRDSLRFRNVICIVVLTGHARFCICDDRDRTNQRELPVQAGHVILLRAPGFRSSEFRPFHCVENIQGERIVAVFCHQQDQSVGTDQ